MIPVWASMIVAAVEQDGFPVPIPEHRFHPQRLWRFDLAWPELLVAFEREGGTGKIGQSRHTRPKGYEADCEKYSEAAILGWCVIRGTARMIEDGRAVSLLLKALDRARQRKAV